MANRTSEGHFFEDFRLGMRLVHATPRTVRDGDVALYIALTGDRRSLSSSDEFARALGFSRALVPELVVFHIVFGKTVADISLNAVANLGYADVRFLAPVHAGETLRAESEVIGLRETSSGKSGIVYVSTRGFGEGGREVLAFKRWVLVEKRDHSAPAPEKSVPDLPAEVAVSNLPVPAQLDLSGWEQERWATGGEALWEDYSVGDRIVHLGGMTVEEADHMTATRLYQNGARVHFDGHGMAQTGGGKRLVYGGHVISLAHALAYGGLENLLYMAAWNGGTHSNPTVSGDTLYATTEVLAREEIPGRSDLGALRLRMIAYKNADPYRQETPVKVAGDGGREKYHPNVVLDLDYWGVMPRRV